MATLDFAASANGATRSYEIPHSLGPALSNFPYINDSNDATYCYYTGVGGASNLYLIIDFPSTAAFIESVDIKVLSSVSYPDLSYHSWTVFITDGEGEQALGYFNADGLNNTIIEQSWTDGWYNATQIRVSCTGYQSQGGTDNGRVYLFEATGSETLNSHVRIYDGSDYFELAKLVPAPNDVVGAIRFYDGSNVAALPLVSTAHDEASSIRTKISGVTYSLRKYVE